MIRARLLHHTDNLAGTNDHFGSLLFRPDGSLALQDERRTWLYTGSLEEERWVSYTRWLDVDTLATGAKTRVLVAHDDDDWATIHLVLAVTERLYVAFYSTGPALRAAVAERPDGAFRPVPGFRVVASDPWEMGCTIESDGGFHAVTENDHELVGWVLYDTLRPDTGGRNGWVLVRIDKTARAVTLIGKHPVNPLPHLLPGRLAARTGSNLASDVRVQGRRALWYLSKRDAATYHIGVALSDDPLFTSLTDNLELDGVLGAEQVIEKFQVFERGGCLNLIYEVGPAGERRWRTGLRRYRLDSAPG